MRIPLVEVCREPETKLDKLVENLREPRGIKKGTGKPFILDKHVEMYRAGDVNDAIEGVFQTHKKLLFGIADQFYGLDRHTVESTIREQIWRVLEDYDETKSQAQLTTVLGVYIKRSLRTQTESNNYAKRKINESSVCSFFSEFEQDEDRFDEASDEDNYGDILIREYVKSHEDEMTDNQRKYCKSVIEFTCDNLTMSKIAEDIGVSRAGALQIRKSLQIKFADLIL